MLWAHKQPCLYRREQKNRYTCNAYFLEINGIEVECTDEKLVGLGLDTASGVLKTGDIKKWITEHTEK